ncbi:hypothetical protein ACOTVO_04660 [Aliarcobacter butzleri]
MSKVNIRVAKFRVEDNLKKRKFPTENNLRLLLNANIDIKPYIKQFKKNLDLFVSENIQKPKTNGKV